MKPTFLESGGPPDSFEPKMSLLGQIGKKQTGTLCKIFGRVSSPLLEFFEFLELLPENGP